MNKQNRLMYNDDNSPQKFRQNYLTIENKHKNVKLVQYIKDFSGQTCK